MWLVYNWGIINTLICISIRSRRLCLRFEKKCLFETGSRVGGGTRTTRSPRWYSVWNWIALHYARFTIIYLILCDIGSVNDERDESSLLVASTLGEGDGPVLLAKFNFGWDKLERRAWTLKKKNIFRTSDLGENCNRTASPGKHGELMTVEFKTVESRLWRREESEEPSSQK